MKQFNVKKGEKRRVVSLIQIDCFLHSKNVADQKIEADLFEL